MMLRIACVAGLTWHCLSYDFALCLCCGQWGADKCRSTLSTVSFYYFLCTENKKKDTLVWHSTPPPTVLLLSKATVNWVHSINIFNNKLNCQEFTYLCKENNKKKQSSGTAHLYRPSLHVKKKRNTIKRSPCCDHDPSNQNSHHAQYIYTHTFEQQL